MNSWLIALWMSLCLPLTQAWGWSEHNILTRSALGTLWNWDQRQVEPTSFETLLLALDIPNAAAFNESIQIHKAFRFEFKANEKPGERISALEVLSTYSDEPDWHMDENLFADDQYPDLWKSEYAMMGGRDGTGSRSFRHLFWRSITFWHPIKTLKLPPQKIFSSMGTAPDRAAAFLNLSRQARAHGQEYWSLRFLGNALHYLEDVSSPFHSTQSPTKIFALMPFTNRHYGRGHKHYVDQVTRLITYYHFAFEDYIGRIMHAHAKGEASPVAETLEASLAQPGRTFSDLTYRSGKVNELVRHLADVSVKVSAKAARASIGFFPPVTTPFDQLDVSSYQNETWWDEVMARGARSSKEKKAFIEVARQMFAPVGFAVREVVRTELTR